MDNSKVKANTEKVKHKFLKPYATMFGVNSELLKAKIIESPVGSILAVSDEKNLLSLHFCEEKNLDKDLKHLTQTHSKSIVEDGETEPLKSIELELNEYFKGNLTKFTTPFEINSKATEFQQAVWNEIYKIGYGSTSTYSELAQRIGNPKSFRAVANACGRNLIPIVIPCHRVLASNGLGGFSSGVEKKIWLLDLEKKVAHK